MTRHPLITWLQCTACQQWLPANHTYFGRRALAGTLVRCVCLSCRAAKRGGAVPKTLQVQPDPERTCVRCNETWPLTLEFFHHQSGRWLSTCRACEIARNRARRTSTAPMPHISDAIAPLLTGTYFFRGAQIGRVSRFTAQP